MARQKKKDMRFAEVLKRLREAAGLSQAQLAERSGVAVSYLRELEQGRRQPGWEKVQALAKALELPTDAFRYDG